MSRLHLLLIELMCSPLLQPLVDDCLCCTEHVPLEHLPEQRPFQKQEVGSLKSIGSEVLDGIPEPKRTTIFTLKSFGRKSFDISRVM